VRVSPPNPAVDRVASERGAALVEIAVALPILLMVLLGIITLGITHQQNISLEAGAREAARFGAAYPVSSAGTLDAWLRDVATTAENATTGDLDAGVSSRLLCVAQGVGHDAAGFTRIRVVGSQPVATASTQTDWCFPNQAPEGDTVVQLQLERDGNVQAFLFSVTPRLNAEATTRFERTE
jgi:Flp pilus assembly protein TadG